MGDVRRLKWERCIFADIGAFGSALMMVLKVPVGVPVATMLWVSHASVRIGNVIEPLVRSDSVKLIPGPDFQDLPVYAYVDAAVSPLGMKLVPVGARHTARVSRLLTP